MQPKNWAAPVSNIYKQCVLLLQVVSAIPFGLCKVMRIAWWHLRKHWNHLKIIVQHNFYLICWSCYQELPYGEGK